MCWLLHALPADDSYNQATGGRRQASLKCIICFRKWEFALYSPAAGNKQSHSLSFPEGKNLLILIWLWSDVTKMAEPVWLILHCNDFSCAIHKNRWSTHSLRLYVCVEGPPRLCRLQSKPAGVMMKKSGLFAAVCTCMDQFKWMKVPCSSAECPDAAAHIQSTINTSSQPKPLHVFFLNDFCVIFIRLF